MAMTQKQYKLALEITANARRAKLALLDVEKSVASMNAKSKSSGNFLTRGFSRAGAYAGSLYRRVSSIYSISKKVLKPFVTGFSTAFSWLTKISTTLLKLPLKALKWGAMGVGAIAGGMYLGHKALQPAAKVQRYEEQFRVQGTPEMLPWLKKMALNTTNTLDELIQSTILMQNFKIDPKKYLTPIMDLSNMFNKPLEEIVRSLGMLKSERYGEALESLARSGITRNDLKELGIKFEKSGTVADKSKNKVFETVIGLIKTRYGGASSRRAQTYEGQVSMLSDAIFNSMSEGLRGFLPYATTIVQTLRGWILNAGEALKTIDWDSIGKRLVGYFQKAKNVADKMLTGEGRKNLKTLIGDAWLGSIEVLDGFITDVTNQVDKMFKNVWDNFGTWWDSVGNSKLIKTFIRGGQELWSHLRHGESYSKLQLKEQKEKLVFAQTDRQTHIMQLQKEQSRNSPIDENISMIKKAIKKDNAKIAKIYAEINKWNNELIEKEAIYKSTPKFLLTATKKAYYEGNEKENIPALSETFKKITTPLYNDKSSIWGMYPSVEKLVDNVTNKFSNKMKMFELGQSIGLDKAIPQRENLTYQINGESFPNTGIINSMTRTLEKAKVGVEKEKGNYGTEITGPLISKINELIAEIRNVNSNTELQPIKIDISSGALGI